MTRTVFTTSNDGHKCPGDLMIQISWLSFN